MLDIQEAAQGSKCWISNVFLIGHSDKYHSLVLIRIKDSRFSNADPAYLKVETSFPPILVKETPNISYISPTLSLLLDEIMQG